MRYIKTFGVGIFIWTCLMAMPLLFDRSENSIYTFHLHFPFHLGHLDPVAVCMRLFIFILMAGFSPVVLLLSAELFSRSRCAIKNSFAHVGLVTAGGMLLAGMWFGVCSP